MLIQQYFSKKIILKKWRGKKKRNGDIKTLLENQKLLEFIATGLVL